VNGDDRRPSLCKSVIGDAATMRRPVVHNPKYPLSRPVWFLAHNLINQPFERLDSRFTFTAAEDFCTVNIPSGKVCQSAFSLIFMFNTHGRSGFGRERFRHSPPRLDAGLLVGGDYIVVLPERHTHPFALIQIQDRPCLVGKLRITRENPATILPGLDGIRAQPSPDGDPTDTGDNSTFHNIPFNFFTAKARQRYAQFRGEFTSQRFNCHHDSGGKIEQGARVWIGRTTQPGAFRKTVCATCSRFASANRAWRQFRHWRSLSRPGALFWHGLQKSTAPYTSAPLPQVSSSRSVLTQSSTCFSLACPPPFGERLCHY